jgi:D-alanyl-D-alanine carboxypeptidase
MTRFRIAALLFFLLIIAGLASYASSQDDAQLRRIREGIQAKLNEMQRAHGFPGATAAFVLPDGRRGSVATGVADLEAKRSMAPGDLMLAGSIGKTFVAAVMMQLAQEGKVSLDDKIARWFKSDPWFTQLPNANEITVRMLLQHSSGIGNHADNENFFRALAAQPDRVWKPEDLVVYVLKKKPLFQAGKGFAYSDTNYILVGMIIERVTGSTLYAEVTRRFLTPLKLAHTIPQEGRVISGVVKGYSEFPIIPHPGGAMIVNGKFTINPQVEWAGGGFASNSEDLARWATALFSGNLLSKPYFDQMLSGVATGEIDFYGLGVEIGEGRWGKVYGHDGLFPGYVSAMSYFPEHRVAVAIQFNTDREKQLGRDPTAYIDDFMKIIVGELTGTKVIDPAVQPSITVDPKILDTYVGKYEIEPGMALTVTRDGNRLMVQASGQSKGEVHAKSETEFFTRGVDAQIKFVKDGLGNVSGLVISQSGRNVPARKIK